MKKTIISTFLILSSLLISSQTSNKPESSTIYLVRTGMFVGSALSSYIKFQNQQPFELSVGSVVQYKIYSEGEITIAMEYSTGSKHYCNLKVKRGNEYFVYLYLDRFSEVSREKVQKYLKKSKKTTQREEDLNSPINRNSIADLKKGGRGQGTCFLVSDEGYLVTNFHCVENSKETTIRGIGLDYATKFSVTIVATDPTNDLALLKISNKNIKLSQPPFAIRSSGVAQAEKVYALGFPNSDAMGDELKITEGIISSKSGAQGDISKLQISAAVNPGNSGGPLIDEEGNLIGVIFAKSTVAESAGYAIKSSYLETFLKNIEDVKFQNLTNLIKDKPITEKVKILKDYIFILETN